MWSLYPQQSITGSEYDTVFIGYPIWWGIAAWPVDEFHRELMILLVKQ